MKRDQMARALAVVLVILTAPLCGEAAPPKPDPQAKVPLRFPLGLDPRQSQKEVSAHLNAIKGLEMAAPISDDSPGHGQGIWSLTGQVKFEEFNPGYLAVLFNAPAAGQKEDFMATKLSQLEIERCEETSSIYHAAVRFLKANYDFHGAEIVDTEQLHTASCTQYEDYGSVAWSAKSAKWWLFVTSKLEKSGKFSVEVSYNFRPVSDRKIRSVKSGVEKAKETTRENL